MKYALLTLLLLAMPSVAQTFNERVIEYRGTKFITKVPNEAPASPAWAPGEGEPPVTVGAAIAIATKAFQKHFAAFKTFHLQNVTLTKQGRGWMYFVVYLQDAADIPDAKPGPNGVTMKHPLSVIYYVTLDGKVYAPEPAPK
jgi:hypothetical protein